MALLVVAGIAFAVGMHAGDLQLYEHYAREAFTHPILRSLPIEYPAASVAVFGLPLSLPFPYAVGFALLAAGAGVALALSSDGLPECPGWQERVPTYLLIGAAAVVFARYDIFPALAAFLAVDNARQDRWARAWGWAVIGGVLKLFPLLLLPGFLLVERVQTGQWPWRRLRLVGAPLLLLVAAQQVIAPGSLLSPISYEAGRGFELSSLPGSLTLMVDALDLHWVAGFGSVEIVGGGQGVISNLLLGAFVAALVLIWTLAWRGQLPVEAVSLAVLSVTILGDKAFAAQYLVWLVPLWAYWPIRRGWVATAALTTAVYPLLYAEADTWGPSFYAPTAVAAVRNVIFVTSTVCGLAEQLRAERRPRHGGLAAPGRA
jgi:hypothetical protein